MHNHQDSIPPKSPTTHSSLISIGKMAKLSGTSIQTLRYYEQEKILLPAYKDPATGYRYYSIENIAKLYLINQLRHLDIPLAQLRELNQNGNVGAVMEQLQKKESSYAAQLLELQKKQAEIHSMIALLNEGLNEKRLNEVYERTYDKRNVIATRKLSACNKAGFLQRYGELLQIIREHQLHITGEASVKIYGKMNEIEVAHADLEISLTVIETPAECSLIQEEPSFAGVCNRYKGSYEEIPTCYGAILAYLNTHQYKTPPYFICNYLINNVSSDSDEEYVTDVIVPILSDL